MKQLEKEEEEETKINATHYSINHHHQQQKLNYLNQYLNILNKLTTKQTFSTLNSTQRCL